MKTLIKQVSKRQNNATLSYHGDIYISLI